MAGSLTVEKLIPFSMIKSLTDANNIPLFNNKESFLDFIESNNIVPNKNETIEDFLIKVRNHYLNEKIRELENTFEQWELDELERELLDLEEDEFERQIG